MRTEDIIEKIQLVSDISGLGDIVNDFATSIGMDGAYLMHYHPAVGLTADDRRNKAWLDHYHQQGYIHFDPVTVRVLGGGPSFTWDDCYAEAGTLTKRQRLLLQGSRDYGMKQGFNVTASAASLDLFTCCYFNEHLGDFTDSMRVNTTAMTEVGRAAQQRMSSLALEKIEMPRLSPRERECLAIAACGKSNDEIGMILGISANTVGGYIKTASKKLGVATKIQAIVKAVQLKLVSPII